jgi:putative endonuclease
MPTSRSRLGRRAEVRAAEELGRLGYRILASNYRWRFGEIDFVCEECGAIVFVEVRCKRTDEYGTPAESITCTKQEKLLNTALHYLDEHGICDHNCRFDVVEVVEQDGKLAVANVIRDALSY